MTGNNRRTDRRKKTVNCEAGMKVTESKPKENEIGKKMKRIREMSRKIANKTKNMTEKSE